MSKLIVSISITLDGYMAADDGNWNWLVMSGDREKYSVALAEQADTLLLGKDTYQKFADEWPNKPNDPKASDAEKAIGNQFNAMKKVVVSTTMKEADWQNTTILRGIDPQEIEMLKRNSEGGVLIQGSASIARQLMALGLIDEYQFLVQPNALGSGKPLFVEKASLKLVSSQQLGDGVMLLTYQPATTNSTGQERATLQSE